jgi:DNA invertase Pin-like site-specific DNA recombinase
LGTNQARFRVLMSPALKIVAYYRVSTAKQGRSGLGLDAQRNAVESYARQLGATIAAEFTDVESGKKADRPGLEGARLAALAHGAAIVVASLDRLSRDVEFIARLVNEHVAFTCADMPSASTFELHIRASVAHEERRKIAERTRLAMAAAKARGRTFGGFRGHVADDSARKAAVAAKRAEAERHARAHIALINVLRANGLGWKAIAKCFTSERLSTPRGGTQWDAVQVRRIAALAA